MNQARLPIIPEQRQLHQPWGPGLVDVSWERCDCLPPQQAGGGHITIRCLAQFGGSRFDKTWTAPIHKHVNKDPLGHHRPSYR